MFNWRGLRNGRTHSRGREILPDEVMLDASNLPVLDADQFEGRVEKPVSRLAIFSLGAIFTLVSVLFIARAFELQIMRGSLLAEAARENTLEQTVVFAERGVMYDRRGERIAWNVAPETATSTSASTTPSYALRRYSDFPGLAHLVGFVRYPKTDRSGQWWRSELIGAAGVEQVFDGRLQGTNGEQITEVDARGRVVREQLVSPTEDGQSVTLSIDAELQSKLHEILAAHAERHGFVGGASVIIDVETGELLALTSFPEYNQQALTEGVDAVVNSYATDEGKPFLNRAVSGSYTPGSIVKPLFAAAALAERVIDPTKQILSTNALRLPNPFSPGTFSTFPEWKAGGHGWVDMRRALAVSSNVYFFTIGGGFEDQPGLGIARLEEWARQFGFGEMRGVALPGEADGVIPTPRWKAQHFADDTWRIGDTYNTAIGQYGFQVTPLQAAIYIAAIANGGEVLTPQLEAGAVPRARSIDIAASDLAIVREGMRRAVTDADGTARALNIGGLPMAGKTGTAQVGVNNELMHSWVVGFWPFDGEQSDGATPKYAFATVLERAPAGTLAGAAPAMQPFFLWLRENRPAYVSEQ